MSKTFDVGSFGAFTKLDEHVFTHPKLGDRKGRGKVFMKKPLGLTGMEISLNKLKPGFAMPFLHKHQQNDEVYVVVGGRGQFLVDSECIDVAEGSVLRLYPAAARAWRNNSDAPLYFLCLQYRADSVIEGGTADGRKAEGNPAWPT